MSYFAGDVAGWRTRKKSSTAHPSIWKCSTAISTALSEASVNVPVSRVRPCQAQLSLTGWLSTLSWTPSSLAPVSNRSSQ